MQNNTFSTLFVGQNLIKLPSVDSTNNFLKKLLSNSEPLPEGTVIMADHQFAGRGQQQNTWQVAPGKNLTISALLYPSFLQAHKQFYLNIAVSIGINSVLSELLGPEMCIKWPNDIYYKNKKLGGILIENTLAGETIKAAVIGIGINVNQQNFDVDLADRAISIFQILQKDVNLNLLLADICKAIEANYLQLRNGNYTKLMSTYVSKLYRFGEECEFEADDQRFQGKITGVTEEGLLKVCVYNEERNYGFKEIKFLNL